MNTDRKTAFKKLQQSFGKVTPQEWGRLVKAYFKRWDKPMLISDMQTADKKVGDLDNPNAIFTGGLL